MQTPGSSHGHRWSRIGLTLFFIYLLVYAGYILVAGFLPDLAAAPFGGVNVAIAYGVGLILFAVVLAVIYVVRSGNSN